MIQKKYDLIIAGGGTSGVSCAWNAARYGLKVLVVEKTSCLGGAITNMLVIPAMKTSNNSINNDFFNKLYDELYKINGAVTYSDGNKGWFNPELVKIILDKLLIENNVDILFETEIKNINYKNNKILSVDIDTIYTDNRVLNLTNKLLTNIETRYLIDATGDGKICEKLNCKILKNPDEIQPVSLRFILSGVNIKEFENWITNFDTDRNVTSSCIINNEIHLSTAYTWDTDKKWALRPLFEQAIANKELDASDCNYFQLFTIPGAPNSVAFNAPRIINEELSRSEKYIHARQVILKLANFCKKYLKGFENSYISNIANTLGVRVSNRYEGKYVYKYDDLIKGKKFTNPVLISDYPIDIHSAQKNNSMLNSVRQEYQLPLESLISKDFVNLFVIGKAISAEYEALGALRIIPSCFSMGEGVAKYIKEML